MVESWIIKAAYSLGGHTVTDTDGKMLRFTSEEAAKEEATVRNMNRSDTTVYYIAVKES